MTVELTGGRLKLKYRKGGKSRYKSGYGGNNRPAKQRRPLTDAEKRLHELQPEVIIHITASGKRSKIRIPR